MFDRLTDHLFGRNTNHSPWKSAHDWFCHKVLRSTESDQESAWVPAFSTDVHRVATFVPSLSSDSGLGIQKGFSHKTAVPGTSLVVYFPSYLPPTGHISTAPVGSTHGHPHRDTIVSHVFHFDFCTPRSFYTLFALNLFSRFCSFSFP